MPVVCAPDWRRNARTTHRGGRPPWTARDPRRRTWPTWSRPPQPAMPTTRRSWTPRTASNPLVGRVRRHRVGGVPAAHRRRADGRRPGGDPLARAVPPRRRRARGAAGGRGGRAGTGPATCAAVVAHCAPRLVDADRRAGDRCPPPSRCSVRPDLDARAEPVAAVGGGEDIALLVYTSDARAASACRTARCWPTARRRRRCAGRPITPVDRVLLAQPLFHSYGLAAGLFQVCWAGATAVLPGPGRPDAEWLADIGGAAPGQRARRRAVDLPRAARAADPHELRTALAGLRLCTCGGVAAAAAVGRRPSGRRPGTASSRATG